MVDFQVNFIFLEKLNFKENGLSSKPKLTKKASLFALITLSSIPDEIFLSPHILDFFEEALKPIPMNVAQNATLSSTRSAMNPESSSIHSDAGDNSSQYVYYASFPVDVIVYFHFQPTIIRLCCLPVSRVECLLHLPSIELVMSSKKSDSDKDFNVETVHQLSSKILKHINKSQSLESPTTSIPSGGGLSITGCLSDFSLYIFHPYGGHKNKSSVVTGPHAAYSNAERKDSLSLQVEFVKINISRSRKAIIGESLTQSISFSAICDIGTATFKYDVRRLNEILAFPKAWYRKSIWKKIFIGENTVNAVFSEDQDDLTISKDPMDTSSTSSSSTTSSSNEFSMNADFETMRTRAKKRIDKAKTKSQVVAVVNNPWETLILLTVNFSKLNVSMNMGNVMGNTNWLTRDLMCDGSISIDSSGNRKYRFGIILKNSAIDAKGGIVGGILELSDIRTELNVFEDKCREPQHRITFSLHTLENRVDYMGSSILMVRISDLSASFHDEWRISPKHDVTNLSSPSSLYPTKRPASIYMHGSLKWDQMQMLMSKSTSPDFIKIAAKLEEFFTQQLHSGKRVFDSLYPFNKSTNAPSNIRSSFRSKNKRTQSINSAISLSQLNDAAQQPDSMATIEETEPKLSHHRHWQKALEFVTGIYQVKDVPDLFPTAGTILGGTIEVKAQNISLACFFGVNFRSKSWAVFSLKQPSFVFMTESQRVKSDGEPSQYNTHVVQNLSLLLGRRDPGSSETGNASRTMATVSKISRNVMFPPQFRHLHEWFDYAFSAVDIDDVNRFPLLSIEKAEFDSYGVPVESLTSTPQFRNNSTPATDKKVKSEFNYKEEMIFAFPSMQLELRTEHLQGLDEPKSTDSKPEVLCSFMSDFDDHIYVAVDAEAYFFLHDLIMSYINETSTNTVSRPDEKNKVPDNDSKEQKETSKIKQESEEVFRTDFRDFISKVRNQFGVF